MRLPLGKFPLVYVILIYAGIETRPDVEQINQSSSMPTGLIIILLHLVSRNIEQFPELLELFLRLNNEI